MEFSQPGNYDMSPEMASSGVFVEVSGGQGIIYDAVWSRNN